MRFSLVAGAQGLVTVQVDPPGDSQFAKGTIQDEDGEVVALLDETWKWERQGAHATLAPGKAATLAIATKPLAAEALVVRRRDLRQASRADRHDIGKTLFGRAMNVECPSRG